MINTHLIKIRQSRLTPQDLAFCIDVLQKGGVIAFPTDTVYGLGCNAFHVDGVRKIYALKGRTYSKPLPILLDSMHHLSFVAKDIPPETHRLIKACWPGPLTLVLKTAPMALHAVRGKGTVAVRIPKHGVARQILDKLGLPLAATSANRSGQKSLTKGTEVKEAFWGRVDVIVDGGACPVGRESSVVDATHYPFTVLREGAISKNKLADILKLT